MQPVRRSKSSNMASLTSSSLSSVLSTVISRISLCLMILAAIVNSAVEKPDVTTVPVTNGVIHRFPNPWTDPEQCRRTGGEQSWICDVDGVLLKEDADAINVLLVGVNTNALCVCNCSKNSTLDSDMGYVLAVAVVKTLEIENLDDTKTSYLKQISETMRQDWFDDRVCGDSGLILTNINNTEIFISLGDVLDNLLSDQSLPLIYKAIQPSLDAGDIVQALNTTIRDLSSLIDEMIIAQTKLPPNNLVWGILGVIAISSILLFHYWIKY